MVFKSPVVWVIVVGGLVLGLFPLRLTAIRAHHPRVRSGKGEFTRTVSGYKIRLVAIANPSSIGKGRLADHAWTPDGLPYEGPDSRLWLQDMVSALPMGGERRIGAFEIEQMEPVVNATAPKTTTNLDVFGYLPQSGVSQDDLKENSGFCRPAQVRIWHGSERDSAGKPLVSHPGSVSMDWGIHSTDPQSVVVGVAEGDYKTIASVPTSLPTLPEGQSSTLASGIWGRVEVTHLGHPMSETKPAPAHRFRLLGGSFPPKSERWVIFYDSKGTQVVACGDGPNIPGYINRWAKDIARIEVQERPYSYVDFDRVAFDPQETPKGYRGQEGRDHTIDTPIGKVVGVLKPTHDGAWVGSLLYATDGVRWLDPEPSLAGMEQGMFDPWDHPADNRRSILIEPNEALVASKTPTKIEIFAADSPDGPNQERLTIWDELPLRLPISEISCNPTERPYMRLDVRVGDGDWRTIETIPITDKMLNVAKRGVYGTRVLEVSCLSNGGISTWKDQPKPIPSPSKWRPDQEIVRVVARLHDGQTLEVNFNEAGGSPTNAVSFRGLALTRQAAGTYIPSGAKNLDIRDISALEIQVQDLKHPVAIPLHTPIR